MKRSDGRPAADSAAIKAQAPGTGTTLLNVGQGHYATTNNWWLGGSAVTSSVPSLDVPVANGAYTLVLPLSGDHDSFKFGPGTVRQ